MITIMFFSNSFMHYCQYVFLVCTFYYYYYYHLYVLLPKLINKGEYILNSCIRPRVTTLFSIPTIWRRYAMTIDMMEILTSPHSMYNSATHVVARWSFADLRHVTHGV